MSTGHYTLKRNWRTILDDGIQTAGLVSSIREVQRDFEEHKTGRLGRVSFYFSCANCTKNVALKIAHLHRNHWQEDAAPSVQCPSCSSQGDHRYVGAQ